VTTTRVTTTAAAEAVTASSVPESGRPRPGRPATLLAELFDAHAPLVLGTCHGMLRDAHEAEDAAQQTFLSAYAALLGGTAPRDPPAWLATIARNECRTRIQQQMRRPLPVAEAYVETADPAARADQVEGLRRALGELPRQQQRAFVLREFNGLSYEELALALDVTQPAVESLLFRARQRLRGSLRAAAAAAASLPGGIRDFFGQLLTGPSDGPATLAKLGSAPVLAKLASVGAGTALMTASGTGVMQGAHLQRHQAAPAGRRVSHVRPAIVRSQPELVARDSNRREAEHTAVVHDPRRRDVAERSLPASEPRSTGSGRDSSGPSHTGDTSGPSTSSGSGQTTIEVESSDGGDVTQATQPTDGSDGSGTSGDSHDGGTGGSGTD
jgi:RNA polymerase sigma-70 factor, ECF subfamily